MFNLFEKKIITELAVLGHHTEAIAEFFIV